MAKFIEEFYYGNLDPQARSTKQNKTVQKQMEVLMLNEDFLTEHLSGDAKKKFLDFCNAWGVVNGESNLDSFIMGFRLGANFTYDTFVSEDSPFTDLLKEAYGKTSDNLTLLKSEVVKSIRGESSFSTEMLSDLIREAESECARLEEQCADARRDVKDTENFLRQLSDHFDELISWAELYDSASLEKKKMVVNALINRIEVSRDYKVKIDFNFDFEQFTNGLDIAA